MADSTENWNENVIARIQNRLNKDQCVNLVYLPSMGVFITEGIFQVFGIKEIVIPSYLVIKDLELIGSILSTILEDMARCAERGQNYKMIERFELFGKNYVIDEKPLYFELSEEREDFMTI